MCEFVNLQPAARTRTWQVKTEAGGEMWRVWSESARSAGPLNTPVSVCCREERRERRERPTLFTTDVLREEAGGEKKSDTTERILCC